VPHRHPGHDKKLAASDKKLGKEKAQLVQGPCAQIEWHVNWTRALSQKLRDQKLAARAQAAGVDNLREGGRLIDQRFD
jgi:hypothetical protein